MAVMTWFRNGSAEDFGVLNSVMSAPPENMRPAPVMTTASIPSSAIAASMPAIRPVLEPIEGQDR